MPSFSGQYEYVDAHGGRAGAGPCELTFNRETLAVAPANGSPLAFDLGDVDSLAAAEYRLTVRLYTGASVVFGGLGKAFQTVDRDLRSARRDRFVTCLLLSDLDERARYECVAELSADDGAVSGPAEIRLYESNIAVLPDGSAGTQVRLADVDDVRFDAARYAVEIRAGRQTLILSRLAKRTEEFRQQLQQAMGEVAARSGRALLGMLPFLSPDELARAAAVMKEGRTVAMADLSRIDPRIEAALLDRAAGASHRPYIESLLRGAVRNSLRVGFRLLEASPPDDEPEAQVVTLPESEASEASVVFWLFVPLPTGRSAGEPGMVAWEPTTGSGRATYFFRLSLPGAVPGSDRRASSALGEEVEVLNRAIVSLNFRREPIYLDDTALGRAPEYRRYIIAARRLPDLRRLRGAFAGRALHTTLDRWQAEVDAILNAG